MLVGTNRRRTGFGNALLGKKLRSVLPYAEPGMNALVCYPTICRGLSFHSDFPALAAGFLAPSSAGRERKFLWHRASLLRIASLAITLFRNRRAHSH